jgi:AcrR family transcriptional regulator
MPPLTLFTLTAMLALVKGCYVAQDPVPSRRERLRAATKAEIVETARRLLVADGLTGVTLRAISRDMGMTAPALYRYYDSLDTLLESLCAALFDECTAFIERRMAGSEGLVGRLASACRAFRDWSLVHPAEFGIMFASPVDASGPFTVMHAMDSQVHAAAMRFAGTYLALFVEAWHTAPFPVPSPESMPRTLREQLTTFLAQTDADLPVGAGQIFLSCWIRLYGMVALELFGHLRFALIDAEGRFETELAACAQALGLVFPPPVTAPS